MLVGIAPGVRVLERYEIVERLPEYGLGEAWRAKDMAGRGAPLVALKFLRGLPAGQDGLPHALDQHLRALRSLQHGNIVRTLGHGLYERRPVVVHAHFAARSLAFGLRPEDGPPPELIERLHDRVVAALVAAREARGLTHGAIDPRSVLVARAGPQNFELRVLDFGLAPYADWLHGAEAFHALATRRAPELAPAAEATAASEVFALGEFTRVLFGEAPEFKRPRGGVPPVVWGAVQRATAATPDHRYESIEAFHADFQRLWRASTATTPPSRAQVAAKTLLDVDVDATVIEPNRARPGEAKRPAPPPVAKFPERVMERAAQPRQDATVLVLPPLPQSATPPTPALTLSDDADVTVRVSHMARRASPWDSAPAFEPTEVFAPPVDQPPDEPPPPPPPPKPRQDDARAPEPEDAGLAVDDNDLREERRMRWLLGAIVVAVVGLAGVLVALLSSRG